MKKNIITTVLGIALLTVAPTWAQKPEVSELDKPQTLIQHEIQVIQTDSIPGQLTLEEEQQAPTTLQTKKRPKLQEVRDVFYRPHGRSIHSKPPEPKPMIHVEGFD